MRDEHPTLERLFDAARNVERDVNPDRERLRGAVASRLTAAGALSASLVLTGKATASALNVTGTTFTAAGKVKLALVLTLAGLGAAGTVLVVRMPPMRASIASGAKAASGALVSLPVTPVASIEVATPTAVTTTPPQDSSAQLTPIRTSPPMNRPEHGGLAEELAIVRNAQSVLASGQPTRVLTLLEAYFRRFPAGVLLPEAQATQIKALCLSGLNEQANRQAVRFEAAHPDSPLAASHKLRCVSTAK